MAKKLYVSESAIFRLCKKISLSGYSELKYELEEGVYRRLSLQPAPGECGQADGCHAISD
ncbi:hypothetical protein BTI77_08230 [Lactobacillus delbrueckii subsp. bulgaricus]|nr:hypothetical protein [Lactobacillus delbrueckii subsp. bulgaricus]